MNNHWWQQPAHALDHHAQTAAAERQNSLTKPPGSLGELESAAIRLAGMQGKTCPELKQPWISIFAGDHGIAAEGVSAFPQEVTPQMVANFAHGGAAITVLARQIGARFEVVDVGVASDTIHHPTVIQDKVALGTANFTQTAAMTVSQLEQALAAGRSAVKRALTSGADCFIAGEMGIANTTSASALACVWLKASPAAMCGPGTGLNAQGVNRKAEVIARALQLHADRLADPKTALATFGGFEVAAMTGAYIAAAQAGLPVIVDGLICTVSALAARLLNPGVEDWFFYGHQSAEPAHARVLEALKAKPLLQLGMRLGEGSGAATAFPLLQLACALHCQMATFAEAGVASSDA